MKNLHLLLLVAALMLPAAIATGAPVTLEQAMFTAEAHAMQCAPRRAPGAVVTITPPSLAATARDASGAVDYYVFNTHAGFVIVAGDDRCVPVLGYSDQGEFDPDNVPAGLQYMLDNYAAQVAYLHANPDVAPVAAPSVLNTEVKPLLKSNWGQNEPFNRLCPDLDSETKCATGCVATAAAQIMYYHKYPTSGENAYDWDQMLPNYIAGVDSCRRNNDC